MGETGAERTVLGRQVITLEEYSARRTLDRELPEAELIIVAVSQKNGVEIVQQPEKGNCIINWCLLRKTGMR